MGVTNTLVLLTSSLLVVLALNALRTGQRAVAARAVAAAIVCGIGFIALKVMEYVSLAAAGHGPGANHFYLYYFILTGLHLFHVCLGLGALTFVLTQTRRTELSATRTGAGRRRRLLLASGGPAVDLPVRPAVSGELT